jgi:CheY-like chemotaxis protein
MGATDARSVEKGEGSDFAKRSSDIVAAQEKSTDSHVLAVNMTEPCKRRILVVDDNRDSADSLSMLLRVLGNDVQTAHDGLDAIDVSKTFQPDFVLLDIGLPRMNGYDAARHIRGDLGSKVVLIALTGRGQDEDLRRSKDAGFDHHLIKPIEFETLRGLLSAPLPNA